VTPVPTGPILGFREWWRRLHHGSEDTLDDAHLMRMAGRFSRRVHGFARAHGIPIIDCRRGERKHRIAEEYPATRSTIRRWGAIVSMRWRSEHRFQLIPMRVLPGGYGTVVAIAGYMDGNPGARSPATRSNTGSPGTPHWLPRAAPLCTPSAFLHMC
jgi:hypothetical protein